VPNTGPAGDNKNPFRVGIQYLVASMNTTTNIGILFGVLAVFFAVLAIRDYMNQGSKFSPAQKTWMLISIIFALVSIGLIY